MQCIGAHWVGRITQVLAELGVADAFEDGPRTPEAAAKISGVHPDALRRVLRAAASVGLFAEFPDGRYSLTPVGEGLLTGSSAGLRDFGTFFAQPWYWNTYSEFAHSLRTGQSAFRKFHGMGAFEWLAKHPEASAVFSRAMTSFTTAIARAVVEAYDFAGIRTLVDVGGGHGLLLATVLKAHPKMRGVVFDLPAVAAGAREPLARAGVASRCTAVGGSFFEAVPHGDAHILKHIIHDWDDERAVSILRHCRATTPRSGRLLLVEMVLPEGPEPHPAKLLDLEMLAMTEGGRERGEGEFRRLFEIAGFHLRRIVPTKSPACILEGVPV